MEASNLQFLLKNEHLLKIFHFFRIKYPEVFIKISVLIYSKMSNGANVTVIERKAGSPSSFLYHDGVFDSGKDAINAVFNRQYETCADRLVF